MIPALFLPHLLFSSILFIFIVNVLRISHYILVFLFLSLSGKACSLKKYEYCKLGIGRSCSLCQPNEFIQDIQSGNAIFKLRYKPKGLQIINSKVPALSFNNFYTYSEYQINIVGTIGSFFLYNAKGKRGPPNPSIN